MSAYETRLAASIARAARRHRNLVTLRGSDCRQSLRRWDKKEHTARPFNPRDYADMELLSVELDNEMAYATPDTSRYDHHVAPWQDETPVVFARRPGGLSSHVDLDRAERVMLKGRYTNGGVFTMA